MEQIEIFFLFTLPLERGGFEYMTTGSVASMVYGIPRFTNDLDIVLAMVPERTTEFAALFPIEEFYCPPVEVLAVESRRKTRGHFNLIHHQTGYKADIYLLTRDDLHIWAMRSKRQIRWEENKSIWIAPPEYVIVAKLLYFREGGAEKHISDIHGMIAVSGELMDYIKLEEWIARYDLQQQWALIESDQRR